MMWLQIAFSALLACGYCRGGRIPRSPRDMMLLDTAAASPAKSRGPSPSDGTCIVDIMLVIDSSESVTFDFAREKAEAIEFVAGLNIHPTATRVGLIEYDDHARTRIRFGQHSGARRLAAEINAIVHSGGSTNTQEALELALREFQAEARPGATLFLLLVTDGHSQNMLPGLKDAIQNLADAGVKTFSATASDGIGMDEFAIFTDGDYRRMYTKNNITRLHEAAPGISMDCMWNGQFEMQDVPLNPVEGCPVDFMVILDNSESVTQVFNEEKNQAEILVHALPIGPAATRVGLIQFHDHATTVFGFGSFTDEWIVTEAIQGVEQVGGTTNTQEAFQLALAEFAATARPGAYKSALVISDGHSKNIIRELKVAAKALIDSGVDVFVATASDDIDPEELAWYANYDYGKVYLKSNVTQLRNAAEQISDRCEARRAKLLQ